MPEQFWIIVGYMLVGITVAIIIGKIWEWIRNVLR